MKGAMNADRDTKDRLRFEFRKVYLREYQRERRENLTPVTLEFTDKEMRSIVPKSNRFGQGLSTYLKTLVLSELNQKRMLEFSTIEVVATLSTSLQVLTLIQGDILDETKKTMLQKMIGDMEKLIKKLENDSQDAHSEIGIV